MTTVAEPDTFVLDETLLNETLSCSYDDRPAEWIVCCRVCGTRRFWCDTCHDYKLQQVQEGEARAWRCVECPATSRNWHDQFFTYPI